MLQVLLMAEGVVSVGKQRVDMYYRNDPSEYSLNSTVLRLLLIYEHLLQSIVGFGLGHKNITMMT